MPPLRWLSDVAPLLRMFPVSLIRTESAWRCYICFETLLDNKLHAFVLLLCACCSGCCEVAVGLLPLCVAPCWGCF